MTEKQQQQKKGVVPDRLKQRDRSFSAPDKMIYVKPGGKGFIASASSGEFAEELADPANQIALSKADSDTVNTETDLPEFLWKILVIGDIGVGKTALIKRWAHNLFSMHYKSTVGVDFALRVLQFPNAMIRLQLWDIAGQERFGNLTRVYYKEAMAAVVVCDDRYNTYQAVARWVEDLRHKCKVKLPDKERDLPIMLLVNKSDLNRQYEETWEEIVEYATQLGCFSVAAVSAKNASGTHGVLVDLVQHLANIKAFVKPEEEARDANIVDLRGDGRLGMPGGDQTIKGNGKRVAPMGTVTLVGEAAEAAERYQAVGRPRKCCNT